MNKKIFLNFIGLILMVMTFTMCKSQSASAPSTPEEALAELITGNDRYVNEKCINPRSDMERVEETAPHQTPFAAVVGCSDSRVPVELLFFQCERDFTGNIGKRPGAALRPIRFICCRQEYDRGKAVHLKCYNVTFFLGPDFFHL